MLATDGLNNHPDILQKSTLDEMQKRPYSGSSYALGWKRNNSGTLEKDGAIGGGSSFIKKFPSGVYSTTNEYITVAVTTNISSDSLPISAGIIGLANSIGNISANANFPSNTTYDLYHKDPVR